MARVVLVTVFNVGVASFGAVLVVVYCSVWCVYDRRKVGDVFLVVFCLFDLHRSRTIPFYRFAVSPFRVVCVD